jgi:thiol-disulfide isomerase/thioredoxin
MPLARRVASAASLAVHKDSCYEVLTTMFRPRPLVGMSLLLSCCALPSIAWAQPTVRQALSLVPMQQDVPYDRPEADQIDRCSIEPQRTGDQRAWVVTDPNGSLLRRFTDSNGDNKIDQWCYFQGGVETYRDIDGDFNEKADQYRWFGTAGLRWGLDRDEDGRIESWKWISPEEVTAELVRAVARQDVNRFAALLITEEELKQTGLSDELAAQITRQIAEARERFTEFARQQNFTDKTQWVDFSAPTPGVIPGGSEQAALDLVVYESVMAMVDTEGKHGQLQVGTLIKVGDRWCLISLPSTDDAGFFFRVADRRIVGGTDGVPPVDPQTQQLVQKLEELDKQLAQANNAGSRRRVYTQRMGVLRDLISASQPNERDMWLLQLVDNAVALSQPAPEGEGAAVLEKVAQEIADSTENKEVIAQAKFAYLTAEYSESLQAPEADFAKIQFGWIERLEEFVKDFSGTRPAAEAMLQLAISEEFAGNDTSATDWYGEIASGYADSDMAEKARGAIRRLSSVGQPLELRGKGLTGDPIDLAELRGNLVVVHYWATWCEPCKQDMDQLKKLLAQYNRRKLRVIGVNLDDNPPAATAMIERQRYAWPHLHESGGLESNLAKQFGVFTLPVMLLVDEQGRVANRSISIAELESELIKRFSPKRESR